jgi:hypothetical protein
MSEILLLLSLGLLIVFFIGKEEADRIRGEIKGWEETDFGCEE